MSDKPAMSNDPTFLLTVAASSWLEAMAHQLPQEGFDLLNRAFLHDPDFEVSARVMFRAGAVVLEVSDGQRKTELVRFDVPNIRRDDGFGLASDTNAGRL